GPLCEAIIREFDAMVPALYDEADRQRGHLLHLDRQGKLVATPLLSVSIALVTNEEQPLTHPGQVAAIGAELKAYAKQFDRSLYVRNRRKTP
ncbi:MAG: diguanylate cyclase response regulator, partial [Candidatus Omnitrophica bacterium]|nr:diguanylate cyclase response regulator [Candidatus Omnitrophota bacterium]